MLVDFNIFVGWKVGVRDIYNFSENASNSKQKDTSENSFSYFLAEIGYGHH